MKMLIFSSNSEYSFDARRQKQVGGAERALRWTAEAACDQYWSVVYATVSDRRVALLPTVVRRQVRGVDVRLIQPVAIPKLNRRLALRRERFLLDQLCVLLRDFDPDVALTYAPNPDTWMLVEARARTHSRVKIVERVSGRAWETALGRGGPAAEHTRRAFVERDASFYVSDALRDYVLDALQGHAIVPSGSERVIDLAPTAQCGPPGILPESTMGFVERHTHILSFVAQFKAGSKRQDVAVKALSIIRRSGIDAGIVFAGSGGLLEDVRALAIEWGVESACHFSRYLRPEQVSALVRASDLGLLLTDFEGSSLAVLEYLLMGVPIVMTDIPANREVLEGAPGVASACLCGASPEEAASTISAMLASEGRLVEVRRELVSVSEHLLDARSPQKYLDALRAVASCE
jgi:glycosyltransferase involved in cell wall biosynthesis